MGQSTTFDRCLLIVYLIPIAADERLFMEDGLDRGLSAHVLLVETLRPVLAQSRILAIAGKVERTAAQVTLLAGRLQAYTAMSITADKSMQAHSNADALVAAPGRMQLASGKDRPEPPFEAEETGRAGRGRVYAEYTHG
jgi:hypothetical protein